jgi:hypothetical protein
MNIHRIAGLLFIAFCCTLGLNAQYDWPLLSQPGEIYQRVGNTDLNITYERPSVREREIFGSLVPYGEIWRTGAGMGTTISFDREVWLDGQRVEAGKYALFTIPGPDCWTIILNSGVDAYGVGRYQLAKDQLRFQVPATTAGRHYESVTINLDIVNNNAHFYLNWDDVQVDFPITTTADQEAHDFIYKTMHSGSGEDTQTYAMAANYLQWNGGDRGDIIRLARRANMDGSQPWAGLIEADVLSDMGQPGAAVNVIETLIRLRKQSPYPDPHDTEMEIKDLENRLRKFKVQEEEAKQPLHLSMVGRGDGC